MGKTFGGGGGLAPLSVNKFSEAFRYLIIDYSVICTPEQDIMRSKIELMNVSKSKQCFYQMTQWEINGKLRVFVTKNF